MGGREEMTGKRTNRKHSEMCGGKNKIGRTNCWNNRFFSIIELLPCQCLQFTKVFCQILGLHSGIVEDSSLFACHTVSTGKELLTFRKIILPSSSRSSRRRVDCLSLNMNALQSSETPVNCLSVDEAWRQLKCCTYQLTNNCKRSKKLLCRYFSLPVSQSRTNQNLHSYFRSRNIAVALSHPYWV